MQIPVYIEERVDDAGFDGDNPPSDSRSTKTMRDYKVWPPPTTPIGPPKPRPPTESELRGKRNRHAKWKARNKAAKKARRRNRK